MTMTSQPAFALTARTITTRHRYVDPHWYAAYTCANREKSVAASLAEREVEFFLPEYQSVRRWKDRRVTLQLPLFPGYIFLRVALRDRLRVLQIPGLVRLVGFGTEPTALPDQDVEILRSGLSQTSQMRPHPFLTVGRRVRIARGPLAGLSGVLKRRKNDYWVVVSVDIVQRSIIVDVEAADIVVA